MYDFHVSASDLEILTGAALCLVMALGVLAVVVFVQKVLGKFYRHIDRRFPRPPFDQVEESLDYLRQTVAGLESELEGAFKQLMDDTGNVNLATAVANGRRELLKRRSDIAGYEAELASERAKHRATMFRLDNLRRAR